MKPIEEEGPARHASAPATSRRDMAAPGKEQASLLGHPGHRDRMRLLTARLGLTSRQAQTLCHAADGLTGREIARELCIALGTVKLHLTHAYAKLGVTHRSQALLLLDRLAMDHGIDHGQEDSWADWFTAGEQVTHRRRGDVLFARAEPGDRVYLVDEGVIELAGVGRSVGQGEIIGEIAAFAPVGVRTHTAICASDVQLRFLTCDQIRHNYFARPDFGLKLLQLITRRLIADREQRTC